MIPLIVLVVSFAVFLAITKDWYRAARYAFAVMFLLTAAAHFVPVQRVDLVRMVPPSFPSPGLIVTITGLLEIAGAIGLVVPRTARLAAASLAVLLLAMFPANVYAAVNELTLMGKPATALVPRAIIQLIFLAGLTLIAAKPRSAPGTSQA